MNEATSSTAESSLLLSLLAAVVAVLAAYVSLGWIREGQRQTTQRQRWLPLLLSSSALGTGICASMVLALSAQALAFPLGYRAAAAPALWLGAIAGCAPAMAWLMRSRHAASLVGAGAWLAALAAAVQWGWVRAAGFRPGIEWRSEFVATAAVVMAVGAAVALWLAFSTMGQEGRQRQLWRLSAAALLGLCLIAAQEVLLAGAGLVTQVGSVYVPEVPASALCLLGGVVTPLVLAVLVLDLEMRRRQLHRRVRGSTGFTPQRRRKRRHRVREL
jgi:NO-binding membrane sensor protein with MHYT domain